LPIEVEGDFYVAWRLWYTYQADADPKQFSVFHSDEVITEKNTAYFRDVEGWHPFYNHPEDPTAKNLIVRVIVAGNSLVNSIAERVFNENQMLIYPNPATDYFRLQGVDPATKLLNYKLIDFSGRVIMEGRIENSAGKMIEINLPDLIKGVYILRLNSKNITEVHKIIIQ